MSKGNLRLSLAEFPEKNVYLCGPITGLDYEQARHGWRKQFAQKMPKHVHCMSPMRGKDFLKNMGVLTADPDSYPEHLMATSKGIVTRDYNDVKNCDLMVANFLGAEEVSVGSMVEFGFAHALRKPVVCLMELDNPHQHLFVTEIAGYVTDDMDEAATIAIQLLTPGV